MVQNLIHAIEKNKYKKSDLINCLNALKTLTHCYSYKSVLLCFVILKLYPLYGVIDMQRLDHSYFWNWIGCYMSKNDAISTFLLIL